MSLGVFLQKNFSPYRGKYDLILPYSVPLNNRAWYNTRGDGYRILSNKRVENRMIQEYSALLDHKCTTEQYRSGGIRHYATEAEGASRDGDTSLGYGNLQHRAGSPSAWPQRTLYPQCDPEGRTRSAQGRQGVFDHQGKCTAVLGTPANSHEGQIEGRLKYHSKHGQDFLAHIHSIARHGLRHPERKAEP